MSTAQRDAGAQALKSGDPKGAIPLLMQALHQDPRDPQTHAYLGTAYGQLNMPEKAVEYLRSATQLAPQSAAIRYNLGLALERAGRTADAIAAYRNTLSLEPTNERAQQALSRLGETHGNGVVPDPTAPLPGSAGPASSGTTSIYGAVPNIYASEPPPASAYGAAPNIYANDPPPLAPGLAPTPASAAAPLSAYGAPPPVGTTALAYAPPSPAAVAPPPPSDGLATPPAGRQPLGEWSPPASTLDGAGGPPMGRQPLGEWTPAPPPSADTTQSYAPGQGPGQAPEGAARPEPNVYIAQAPERGLSRSEQLGHAYLAGMGTGVGWGLIGAGSVFLWSTVFIKASDFGRLLPVVIGLCLIYLCVGVLIFGGIGLLGGSSDSAEETCSTAGIVLGVFQAALTSLVTFNVYTGVPTIMGCIVISRFLGKSLGTKIDEWRQSVTIVAGPSGMAVTPIRR